MATETLTLKLEGDVPLADFAQAVARFNELVQALTREYAPDAGIVWTVSDLVPGSASATALGTASTREPLIRVRREYVHAGEAVEEGTSAGLPAAIAKPAVAIRKVIGTNVTEVIFETIEDQSVMHAPALRVLPSPARRPIVTRGTVTGRIQTLTSRGGLRFTLFDLLNDRAVSCYLVEGAEAQMRDAWGRLAIVEGLVTRDPVTGRPLAVRQVANVEVRLDPGPTDYMKARGAVPFRSGMLRPEEAIRRLRDA